MMNDENVIFEIILNSGDARTFALKGLEVTRENKMEEALKYLDEAGKKLNEAHKKQTLLIQDEINGNISQLSLLMVHAQDHLMNSMTIRDLAREIIMLRKSDLERRNGE